VNTRPATPLIEAQSLCKSFDTRKGVFARWLIRHDYRVQALNAVSFRIARGETLGLIGESGCGKSTLARVLLRLQSADAGRILFDGEDITSAAAARMTALRRRMQIIFQDPYASLNPRRTVEQIVGLPLRIHTRASSRQVRDEVAAMLERVGLKSAHLKRFPHQFSGGQRQRIGIARALIAKPEFVVCDEPVSALDVSIQAQILHLLQALRSDLGLTLLFIGHNLSVVGYVSERIAVMYLGEIVETGAARDILTAPAHPYTQSLLAAVPRLEGSDRKPRTRPQGDAASPLRPPSGCRFHTRCPRIMPICRTEAPRCTALDGAATHEVACHLYRKAQS
jgi:peptide/nickel transport system ATP-binding protein